jgi:hypothetical protein
MSKAKHTRTHGDHKNFADKQTLNPPDVSQQPPSGTHQPESQDAKRRIGQFTGTGEPAQIKK